MKRKDKRLLLHHMHIAIHIFTSIDSIENVRKNLKEYPHILKGIKQLKSSSIILDIAKRNKISDDKLCEMAKEIRLDKSKNDISYRKMPRSTFRDNKDDYNTGGSSSTWKNKVRYPSKKRSKKTWSNFYKLFPYLAEQDNWDGEKSKRYP